MTNFAKAALIAFLLVPGVPAGASLTVTPGLTVQNKCPSDIMIAVYYLNQKRWMTTPFINIPAHATKDNVAYSDNSVFYYYAESLSGKKVAWSGNRNQEVGGKIYPMKMKTLELDKDRNRYYLGLSCN